MKDKLIITPKTKIFKLLETYPELEDTLLEVAPAFVKLRNPMLRNTIAKIATIQQAAGIGNINISELVNSLRKKVGQDLYLEQDKPNVQMNFDRPIWFDESLVILEFDVRTFLDEGEHPVNHVLSELKQLPDNKIFKLISPFLTVPLIEKVIGLEYRHYIRNKNNMYEIFFIKNKENWNE